MNRAHGRVRIFDAEHHYRLFENLLWDGHQKFQTELLAYCLMPNHWHLLLRPTKDGELSEYMQWLTNSHTRRYHKLEGTGGTGPIYQGRFKSVTVRTEQQLVAVWRYIERNALTAGLVTQAGDWRWSSVWWRLHRPGDAATLLAEALFTDPMEWVDYISRPLTAGEEGLVEKLTWNH